MLSPVVLAKIDLLQRMLTESTVSLPIYIGIQFEKYCMTLGVTSVEMMTSSIAVVTEHGCHVVIGLKEVQDVLAFRDAMGAPLFLNDPDVNLTVMPQPVKFYDDFQAEAVKEYIEWQTTFLDIAYAETDGWKTNTAVDPQCGEIFLKDHDGDWLQSDINKILAQSEIAHSSVEELIESFSQHEHDAFVKC